jgi:hypothetical protein
MGDAYQFTLTPQFNNIHNEFNCHIRQRKQKKLYSLWFYVSVLDSGFETPRIYRTVYPEDVESLSMGTYNLEFLTIEHDAGLDVQEEYILNGKKTNNTWSYTLNNLKTPEEFTGDIEVRTIEDKVHIGIVQFDSPFAYSTSKWSEGNNCRKDLSKIKAAQKQYVEGKGQNVSVIVEAVGQPYKYYIKSINKSSTISFNTPGW